jgi:hypothetical protein
MTNRLWESLSAHVYVFLHQTRLSDVVKNDLTPCPAVPTLFEVVDESVIQKCGARWWLAARPWGTLSPRPPVFLAKMKGIGW